MNTLSVNEVLLLIIIVTIGSAIQGAIGFGWTIFAAPLFLLIKP